MFDRYEWSRPPEVRVNIQQQPLAAADSARLYGELKEKAEREVARATVMSLGTENCLRIVSIDHARNFAADSDTLRILFELNGKLHDVRIERCRIAELCAEVIARELLGKLTSEVQRRLLR